MANGVVVGKRPGGPAIRGGGEEPLDGVAEMAGGKVGAKKSKAVGHVQAVAARGVIGHDLQGAVPGADLAHHGAVAVAVGQVAQAFDKAQILALGLLVDMILHEIGDGIKLGHALRQGRVGAQQRIVEIVVDGVQPEPVHPLVQPEADIFQMPVLHLGVVKVEIGLAGQEVVQIELLAAAVPGPGRSAEMRQPVVGRRAVGVAVGPDVPIGLGIGSALAAFAEKRVLIGRMRQHLIYDDLQAQIMRLAKQGVKIRHGPEQGVDAAVVGHIIAHVPHRRGKNRRQPDRIDAQIGDIRQTAEDPRQIADAVTIAVLKRARIDLIGDTAAPPVRLGHRHQSGRSTNTRPPSTLTG